MDDTRWQELVGSLRSFFGRRLRDSSQVDDALQECFVRVLTGADRLLDEDRFAAWVQRIARNLVNDLYREQTVDPLPDAQSLAAPLEPEDLTRTVAGWVGSVIDDLEPEQRSLLRASELEGVPQREIAARHGLSVSAVKARVRRGRRQIRERLLACCAFEFDGSGRVLDYRRRSGSCGPAPGCGDTGPCGESGAISG